MPHSLYVVACCLQLRKTKRMKKENLPLIIIITSLIVIALNFILISDEMNPGLWAQILSSVILILVMILLIQSRKKQNED